MTAKKMSEAGDGERVVLTSCSHDCGGACVLKVHVKEGRIVRIETDDGEEPQLRACLRGRAYRQKAYSPDRLLYPMKRVGERGEGKFQRISWDEALDTVASELKRVKETYGPAAILFLGSAGSLAALHGKNPVDRLLSAFGGYTGRWCSASNEGQIFASTATFGTFRIGNARDDLLNSRLIVMWGWNPADTIWTTNSAYYLSLAKERGARIICVDPRFTDSAATFADQWIPIRPGTDAAMLIAMAYVMITEELQDQKFLDTYTVGFDKFRAYVLGEEDGIPKTPEWAEAITGVPTATIAGLAREYATTRPAALFTAFGPGRSATGEQYHRAAYALAAMTGNIGIPGGCAGGGRSYSSDQFLRMPPGKPNPVEVAAPPRQYSVESLYSRSSALIHTSKVYDAILEGKAGGYPCDPRLLYVACFNQLNQRQDINKGVQALKKPEFIVVHEQHMTPTARFADILLPVNTFMERNDVFAPWLGAPYYFYMNKAIDSLGESKTDLEICSELASRLDIGDYADKSEEDRLKEIVGACKDIPDYDDLKKKGLYRVKIKEPPVAFKKQIEDPEHNPFPTPSGKIEICSQLLVEMNNPLIPPIPKYIENWEGFNDPLAKKYPLQLITSHFKRRAHSTWDNVPWLRELIPQAAWISSADAQARGISDGDQIRVFNDRGETIIQARVTERIMPGVVDIPQGAWYAPDEKGVDRAGCANVLTRDDHSPGGAFAPNTGLVQIEKA
ncbi:MAG: molybdopterin-dependent oxidoreductase [Chloroflexi bacterium]|nr:molybdopterin-dependent oxidoreductase [Chloroflexota bacterium]